MNYKSIANKVILAKSIKVPTSLKIRTLLVRAELDTTQFRPRSSAKSQKLDRKIGKACFATSFGASQAEVRQSFNSTALQARKHSRPCLPALHPLHALHPTDVQHVQREKMSLYSKAQNPLLISQRGYFAKKEIYNSILPNQVPAHFRRQAHQQTFFSLADAGESKMKDQNIASQTQNTARSTFVSSITSYSSVGCNGCTAAASITSAGCTARQAGPTPSSTNNAENTINKEQTNLKCSWERPTFPFTAIVGQEEMKLALLLNVIDPKIGGVMIMGDRGTGKSTTVRALVDLLPNIEVVDNDPFNSHPADAELQSQTVREQVIQGKTLKVTWKKTTMIDLPLGATEDRVCGTIDIEKALSEGVKAFEPGLLAKANRGILYVDEVNLLDDHLVDILLDSAASGWNTVEREGISISHPARFILVGSGNPEEGELRPQLLDRFGMHAQIGTVREAELRVKIVEERASFDKSPLEFLNIHVEKQKQLADQIVAARQFLNQVKIDYDLRVKISQVCGQLNVDGLRGDIVTNLAGK